MAVTVTTPCRRKNDANDLGMLLNAGIVLVGCNGELAERDRGASPCSDGRSERRL